MDVIQLQSASASSDLTLSRISFQSKLAKDRLPRTQTEIHRRQTDSARYSKQGRKRKWHDR